MYDAWTGEMTPHEALHPCPRPAIATSLTAAANHFEPQTSYLVDETGDAIAVARMRHDSSAIRAQRVATIGSFRQVAGAFAFAVSL